MKTLVHNIDSHPLINFFVSLVLGGVGYGTGHAYHAMMQIDPVSVMDTVVKVFQCFAYAGAGLAGFVSLHGWYKKNFSKKSNKKSE